MFLYLFGNIACYVHCQLFAAFTKFSFKNLCHYWWYFLFNLHNSFFKVIIYKNVLFPKINVFFKKATFFKKISEFVTFVILLRISLLEVVAQRCSVKMVFLEIWLNSQGKTCARLRPTTLLKRNSGKGASLWILPKFWEQLFLQNTSGGCFCPCTHLSIFTKLLLKRVPLKASKNILISLIK